MDAVLRDLDEIILAGITHWQSPNFFAYFPGNTSGPAIIGELLSAGLNVQGMLWATSPACTELETHVLDWLADLLALPGTFRSSGSGGGVIQDSASASTLCAVVAAREKATGSEQPARLRWHACRLLLQPGSLLGGEGHSHRRYRQRPAATDRGGRELCHATGSAREGRACRPAAGLQPFMVVATIGTTSSNALDPLPAIGEICRRHGLWLHVDAAMSGTAAVCPEFRFIHEGLELVDSYVFDPHKWMFGGLDCSCFFVADRRRLVGALGILPEYLRNAAVAYGEVIDYRDGRYLWGTASAP